MSGTIVPTKNNKVKINRFNNKQVGTLKNLKWRNKKHRINAVPLLLSTMLVSSGLWISSKCRAGE
jgi:hypothetical protein